MTAGATRLRTGVTVALLLFAVVVVAARLSGHPHYQPVADHVFSWFDSSGRLRRESSPDAAEMLAHDYLRCGNAAAAASYLAVAAQESADLTRWRRLAGLYRDRADWRGMRDSLSRVLRLDPDHAETHFDLALLLMPFDLRAAHAHLAHVLDDPQFAEQGEQLRQMLADIELLEPATQLARIGQALAALAAWPQAEQAFAASVALKPDFAEAWGYLAFVRAQQDKPVEASAAQALAHAYAGDAGYVHFLVGVAWRIHGNGAQALPALAYAQESDPANPAFALELGTLYRQLGDLAAAEYWLQVAVQVAGDDVRFLRMLALFYAEEQYALTETGLDVLRDAVARLPQDAALLAAHAWALFATGDSEGAQQALDAAFALQADNPPGLYYQGRIYQLEGQPEAARAVFESLLKLAESDGFDQLALRQLQQME